MTTLIIEYPGMKYWLIGKGTECTAGQIFNFMVQFSERMKSVLNNLHELEL